MTLCVILQSVAGVLRYFHYICCVNEYLLVVKRGSLLIIGFTVWRIMLVLLYKYLGGVREVEV